MSEEKCCRGCMWFEQCGCNDVCEDYYPVDDDEREEALCTAYERDLRARHKIYAKQVKEQNA